MKGKIMGRSSCRGQMDRRHRGWAPPTEWGRESRGPGDIAMARDRRKRGGGRRSLEKSRGKGGQGLRVMPTSSQPSLQQAEPCAHPSQWEQDQDLRLANTCGWSGGHLGDWVIKGTAASSSVSQSPLPPWSLALRNTSCHVVQSSHSSTERPAWWEMEASCL